MIDSEVFRVRCHSMGMVDDAGRLTFLDGRLRVVDPAGEEVALFEPRDWLEHLAERVEPWTYAKFTFLKARGWNGFVEGPDSGLYRVGPLGPAQRRARDGDADRRRPSGSGSSTSSAGRRTRRSRSTGRGSSRRCRRPRRSQRSPRRPGPRRRARSARCRAPLSGPREGVGVVEAPRGTLIHHYAADAAGMLTAREPRRRLAAQRRRGADLGPQGGPRRSSGAAWWTTALLNLLEMAFRAYDPCNACASHALPGELPLVVTVRDAGGRVRGRGAAAGPG